LVSVSHSWREVATKFLFADIKISSFGALLRLVEILQHNQPHSKERYTTSIHLNVVIPTHCRDVYVDQVCELLQLCPNLTTFVSVPTLVLLVEDKVCTGRPPFETVPIAIVQALVDNCGERLRSVIFGGDEGLSGDCVDYLLNKCSALESFGSTSIFGTGTWRLRNKNPSLHTLRLHYSRRGPLDVLCSPTDPDDFPSLKHLSITVRRNANHPSESPFLVAHGLKLETLFWSSYTEERSPALHRVLSQPPYVSY
jgi:hypothetical protein